jgi:hypothetical protein
VRIVPSFRTDTFALPGGHVLGELIHHGERALEALFQRLDTDAPVVSMSISIHASPKRDRLLRSTKQAEYRVGPPAALISASPSGHV